MVKLNEYDSCFPAHVISANVIVETISGDKLDEHFRTEVYPSVSPNDCEWFQKLEPTCLPRLKALHLNLLHSPRAAAELQFLNNIIG